MYVVLMGARERDEAGDEKLVNGLLNHLKKLYGSALVVVSAATDRGVGKYVKDRCLQDKEVFKFIDVSTKIFGELPKARLAQVFKARNATLLELGNHFYIFDTKAGKGITEDLVTRVTNAGFPCYVFKPGQTVPTEVKRIPKDYGTLASSQDASALQTESTTTSPDVEVDEAEERDV